MLQVFGVRHSKHLSQFNCAIGPFSHRHLWQLMVKLEKWLFFSEVKMAIELNLMNTYVAAVGQAYYYIYHMAAT